MSCLILGHPNVLSQNLKTGPIKPQNPSHARGSAGYPCKTKRGRKLPRPSPRFSGRSARRQLFELHWQRVPSRGDAFRTLTLPRTLRGAFSFLATDGRPFAERARAFAGGVSGSLPAALRRGQSARRCWLAELAFSHGRALARGQMSSRKAVFVALICAGYVYSAFWIVYFVHSIKLVAANY
jgi:hypothetical protein